MALNYKLLWIQLVLTGVSSLEPIENESLSEAVVGVPHIDDVEEFMSYVENPKYEKLIY